MFGITDFTIDFLTGSPWLVWLFLGLFTILVVVIYRKTNPPIPGYQRIILATLRMIALLALFIALLEPVVGITSNFSRPKRVALLIDRSDSMDRLESDLTRSARVDSLLSSANFESFSSAVDITTFYWGGGLSEVSNEVDGSKTSMGDILHDLGQRNLTEPSDYILLISDGNSNSGRDPLKVAERSIAPVVAVNPAWGGGDFDIGLGRVEFNPIMFAGEATDIKVSLNWQNAKNQTIRTNISVSGKQVAEQRLAIEQTEGLADLTLRYTPDGPGQKILKIAIPGLSGEANSDNNFRSIAVKVLKSKLEILLVSSKPDYEIGFLKRFLGKSSKYNTDFRVLSDKAGNMSGRFPSTQSALNRFDLIILHDLDPRMLESRSDLLKSYLSDKGGALWTIMGENFARAGSTPWIREILPFVPITSNSLSFQEFHGSPVEGELNHPTVKLGDSYGAIRSAWSELPPFQVLVPCEVVNSQSKILVRHATASERWPLLGFRQHGPGKSFATSALPFWSWGFVARGFGEDDTRYGMFLEGLIGWLTVHDDFEPIRVLPEKRVFSRGEPVRFDGFAYDQGYRPLENVTGMVRMIPTDGSSPTESDLLAVTPGQYQLEFNNLRPGDYTYESLIEKDGQILSRGDGSVRVEAFSLEQFDQAANGALLSSVGSLSGGDYFEFSEFDKALASMDREPVSGSHTEEIIIWNKLWLLITIILALSLEWLIRKTYQLI